ncbi:cardiolipin synthase [Peribacillus cavernae]|uniref:Cardiolipin synthase n=1 Tax=Peribacillus cavernae TaxID=1674310 RepID=A0A433HNY7_9BACI|nr:cardiolipin synthase [Peribacillus cavernae]MDQ0217517.1 cardiolipin synthase [Peribacillus cavernae]RUQ30045.1 cardiolipin synthase [Peribacillus cavernae]
MKNTVRVLLLIVLLGSLWFLFRDNLKGGGFLGYFSVLLSFSLIVIGIIIFLENRHPAQTITWLVVFGAFPLVGFIFYFLFGRNYRKERVFRKKYFLDKEAFLKVSGEPDVSRERIMEMGGHQQKLYKLAQRIGNSPISFGTETQILTNGNETFSHILEELKKANHHIHMEYYIVRHDNIGMDIKNILIDKAKQGVKIRFLYDSVGSWQLSRQYIQDLKNAGVEMVEFGPVRLPFLNNKFNFRNHRKIIVIDGSVAFMGGLNIGDEYLGRDEHFGFWRDTHLMLKGEAVRTLQLIFLQDWYYSTDHSFLTDEYLSPLPIVHNHGGVQMIAGGPDNEFTVIKNIFFSMITSAKESVWIASPYFIPDEDIFQALKIAALSGLDVRLLVPKNPDKRIVFHASRSYFPELMEAGVRIFEYKNGFMHSKIVIVDNELASIGTSNMDMRSFHLNFEVNAFLYKTGSTQKLVNDFLHDILESRELHLETFSKRNIGLKMIESTCRLLSPLL